MPCRPRPGQWNGPATVNGSDQLRRSTGSPRTSLSVPTAANARECGSSAAQSGEPGPVKNGLNTGIAGESEQATNWLLTMNVAAHITSLIRRAVRLRRDCAPLKLLTYVWTEPRRSRRFEISSASRLVREVGNRRVSGCLTRRPGKRNVDGGVPAGPPSTGGRCRGLSLKKRSGRDFWRSTF